MEDVRKIKGFDNYYLDKQGNLYRLLQDGTFRLRSSVHSNVTLVEGGKKHFCNIARLMIETFTDYRGDFTIKRIDGDILNNALDNLQVVYNKKQGYTFEELCKQGELKEVPNTSDYLVCDNGFLYRNVNGLYYNIKAFDGRVSVKVNGRYKSLTLARLIYTTFKGNIGKKFSVGHINNDTADNRLCNLYIYINNTIGIFICAKRLSDNEVLKFKSVKEFYDYVSTTNYYGTYECFLSAVKRDDIEGYRILKCDHKKG